MSQNIDYFAVQGGEDLVSPPLTVSPKRVSLALNYECDVNGRLRRVQGYSRFDGQVENDDITAVPGSGIIRGVWFYKGKHYAFRDSTDGTACFMYEAKSTGWTLIVTPALAPGGRYEFDNYNCLANGSGFKMYGVDGKNKMFQYDGTTFTQVATGYTTDTPSHIKGHKLHIFVSMLDGVVQHSGLKTPTSFDAADGAGYIGVGDFCAGFSQGAGDILVMLGRNSTNLLYGSAASGTDPWKVVRHSHVSGAIEHTIQQMAQPVYLDDRGVTSLNAVQEYGDFATNAVSKDVKPFIDAKKALAVSSMILREKGIYRLFYSDGYATSITFINNAIAGITRLLFPDPVLCCCSVEDDGKEITMFGSDSGFVYLMESGTSFDGADIDARITTHYNNLKTPTIKKRIHKATIECESQGPASLSFIARFSSSYGITTDIDNKFNMGGTGGVWDSGDKWNEFIWYIGGVNLASEYINGSGLSFSLSTRSVSAVEEPHTINGLIINYSTRGLQR